MAYLFLDSSYDITLGLLSSGLEWLEFEKFEGQKASRVLQLESYNFLSKHNVDPKNLEGIISIAGPGFYTGLRVSEGFGDLFQFFNIPAYRFYSFEIPSFCGVLEGQWFTKAYRGEYFLAEWSHGVLKQTNVPASQLEETLKDIKKLYIHSQSSLDELSLKFIKDSVTTQDLLKVQPHMIFSQVINAKLNRDSFYFRAPEDEFKMNP